MSYLPGAIVMKRFQERPSLAATILYISDFILCGLDCDDFGRWESCSLKLRK